jgi:hypothetical protein
MLLGCCRRRNCELINGDGHFYTISFTLAVGADTLYHATVTAETDTGIVQSVFRKQFGYF